MKVLQTPWDGPVHMRQQPLPMTLYGPVTCSNLLPMVSLGPICFSKVAANTPGWARCPCNSCRCSNFTWAHTFLTKVLQTPWGGPVHIHQQSLPIALHGPVTCSNLLPMVSLGSICFPKVAADTLGWACCPCNSCCCNSFTWAHTFLTKVPQIPWGGLVHIYQQSLPIALHGPITCSSLLPMVSLGPICFPKVAADVTDRSRYH